jgi:hypothetical protein
VQPGCLPCKAVIRVDLSFYTFLSSGVDAKAFQGGMKDLLEDILEVCDEENFASLAVPLLGVDVKGTGGFGAVSIDVAGKALIDSITQLLGGGVQYENR